MIGVVAEYRGCAFGGAGAIGWPGPVEMIGDGGTDDVGGWKVPLVCVCSESEGRIGGIEVMEEIEALDLFRGRLDGTVVTWIGCCSTAVGAGASGRPLPWPGGGGYERALAGKRSPGRSGV